MTQINNLLLATQITYPNKYLLIVGIPFLVTGIVLQIAERCITTDDSELLKFSNYSLMISAFLFGVFYVVTVVGVNFTELFTVFF